MKASTERKIIRWVHIVIGIPIIRHVYGPPFTEPIQLFVMRWIIFPLLVISGFWLWKGHVLKKWIRGKNVIITNARSK